MMDLNAAATTSLLLLCACIASGERADQGRGSETCRVWQDAACDHFADACGAIDRTTCDQQYQSVTCRSDKVAASCTQMLRSVSCGGASPDCLLGGVANPDPAQAACNDLVDHFCQRSVDCGLSLDKQGCLDTSSNFVRCTRAIGYQLKFETCMEQIAKIDCTALTLPQVCQNVIIARE